MIELGHKYRDRLVGYEGTATARTEFLFDAPSVRLTRSSSDGKPEHEWFPEGQLEAAQTTSAGFTADGADS